MAGKKKSSTRMKMLGTGMARKAGQKMKGRKSRIDSYLAKATGKKKNGG